MYVAIILSTLVQLRLSIRLVGIAEDAVKNSFVALFVDYLDFELHCMLVSE